MLNTISYSIVFLSKKVEDLQETVGDGAIISIKDVFFDNLNISCLSAFNISASFLIFFKISFVCFNNSI